MVVLDLLRNGRTVQLRANGVSMVPTLWPHMNLIAQPAHYSSLKRGDVVLFNHSGETLIAHRIVCINKNKMLIQGDSCTNPDGWIDNKDIVAKVIKAEVCGLKISTTWVGFKVYGLLLLASSPISHKVNNLLARLVCKLQGITNK